LTKVEQGRLVSNRLVSSFRRARFFGPTRQGADSDDLARVYRFDLAQDSDMISPTIPI
jgi:hypothetical protein